MTWAGAGVVAGALIVSIVLGRVVTALVLRRVESEPPDNGVLRGGTWIGMLERAAITGAIIAGFPEGIAVVLAIKGLGRYPELRERHPDKRSPAAERFIIGTLISYTWAGASAVLGLWALQALG